MPIAGIIPYPNIKRGLRIIFKKKLKIKIFLLLFVSPIAVNDELRDI